MKVLVTGGAGYIGSHTCVELIEAGHEPTVIIYPGVRHEILNEDCKETVYNDILGWTQSIL